jgi:hypothetical protein
MENRKDNSGVLFKNDKIENERSPNYKGNITVDGKDYWLSAWIKEGKVRQIHGSSSITQRRVQSPSPLNDLRLPTLMILTQCLSDKLFSGESGCLATILSDELADERVPQPNRSE